MENNDFRMLYKRLIEAHGLSPTTAKQILQNILKILYRDKERKK